MRGIYRDIVWTVIALALSLIALNPWLAPGGLSARGVMEVDIAKIGRRSIASATPIHVKVER